MIVAVPGFGFGAEQNPAYRPSGKFSGLEFNAPPSPGDENRLAGFASDWSENAYLPIRGRERQQKLFVGYETIQCWIISSDR